MLGNLRIRTRPEPISTGLIYRLAAALQLLDIRFRGDEGMSKRMNIFTDTQKIPGQE